ncbi:MAG: hypothetical protein MZV64_45260 [Ignavibacteriales bacterium]|nr:hypothetical protein [Ignavibacteriales bacterium]
MDGIVEELHLFGEYNGVTKKVEISLEPENFAMFGNFYNVFGKCMGSNW